MTSDPVQEGMAVSAGQVLARIDQADATVDALTARIDELLDPYEAAVTLLAFALVDR